MADGVPVRLSAALTAKARAEASFQDRSLTEQVEHWARLGQVVEAAISAASVAKLKARSYDPEIKKRLDFAKTPEGRAKAAAFIRAKNPVRYEVVDGGPVTRASEPRKSRRR